MDYEKLFLEHQESTLYGRYVTPEKIFPLIDKFASVAEISVIGNSVLGEPIHLCKAGVGKTTMLIWSQMHGNEGTTTKSLFDLLNLLAAPTGLARTLLEKFSFYVVPMLNPDGSRRYTRENANLVDLNRDFYDLSQPESQALYGLFKQIKPDFCYNLHDQRTIYGVGETGKPATVSFLAPSYNEQRHIDSSRTKSMSVIAEMNSVLQTIAPGQVGRFDDSFNINCAGDTFACHSTPTILFEAGHYQGDYQREITRKLVFIALVASLSYLAENTILHNRNEEYLNIPQNSVNFNDFVYKNVKINYDGIEKITNFAAQFQESLIGDEIVFEARIAGIGSDVIFGHREFDAKGGLFRDGDKYVPELEKKADFYLGNVKFVNGEIA